MRQFQSSFVISKTTLRWLHLLEHMEHASHVPIRGLSKVIKSSSRTIIEDLQNIKDYFEASIEMETTNSGYQLQIIDAESYLEKKRNLISNVHPHFSESLLLAIVLLISVMHCQH